jgi:epoxyqueuosine reductase
MKIFDGPIFAFGDADDKHFLLLKDSSAIGNHFKLPKEWLLLSKTVISFFLPFTESVKNSNSKDKIWPSEGWLYGRIEGQMLLNKLCLYLNEELMNSGYISIIPCLDGNFWSKSGNNANYSKINNHEKNLPSFTSNWSERHVAFVCGLGTFGLSKGLITKKGIAGRF